MTSLLHDLLPHAPNLGLYVAPHIPADKLSNALGDYASTMHREEVEALYDATLMGSAKDGAVFAADRFVFQNNDLEEPHEIRYTDLVRVHMQRRLLGGRKVELDVNRGRATVSLALDFSGKPKAADYVARFLNEAMLHTVKLGSDAPKAAVTTEAGTDLQAVRAALDGLREQGLLAEADHRRLLDALTAD